MRVGLFHQNHERPWVPAESTDDWRNHYEGGYTGLAASYAMAHADGGRELTWDYVLRHYDYRPLRDLAPYLYVPLGPANAEELDELAPPGGASSERRGGPLRRGASSSERTTLCFFAGLHHGSDTAERAERSHLLDVVHRHALPCRVHGR